MFKLFIYLLLTGTLALRCSHRAAVPPIEGSYAAQFESEFSKARDTIMIRAYNEKAGTYIIIHKTTYQRIRDGRLGVDQYKKESLTGIWSEKTGQLHEQRHGRIYSFPPKGNELVLGSAHYKKVK